MKKIDINNFKYSKILENFICVVEIKDNNYLIKKIKDEDNIKYIDLLELFIMIKKK